MLVYFVQRDNNDYNSAGIYFILYFIPWGMKCTSQLKYISLKQGISKKYFKEFVSVGKYDKHFNLFYYYLMYLVLICFGSTCWAARSVGGSVVRQFPVACNVGPVG